MRIRRLLDAMARVACLSALFAVGLAHAYDHADGPRAAADPPADLGALFGWTTERGTVVLALTVVGAYDRDVLYSLHIDRDADQQPDATIRARFGQDAQGGWGVQFSGLPGLDAPIEGPVDTALAAGALSLFAGQRDDPTFADPVGLAQTRATATLSFTATDGFAGANVTAIVIEAPAAVLGEGGGQVWATTARIRGDGGAR